MKRFAAVLLCLLMLIGSLGVLAEEGTTPENTSPVAQNSGTTYDETLAAHKDFPAATASISPVLLSAPAVVEGVACATVSADAPAEFTVNIPADGRYQIGFDYLITDSKNRDIDYGISVDGLHPFSESATLLLRRSFVLDGDVYKTDSEGNQYIPDLKENPVWQSVTVADSACYYAGGLFWCLTAGEHTLRFSTLSGSFSMAGLTLKPQTELPSYKEYKAKNGGEEKAVSAITIQAENPVARSARSVSAFCDKSSAATSPKATKLQVLNALGGAAWSKPGQSATWNFKVGISGYYKLNFKYRQDYTGGMFVSRRLTIDGAPAFKESEIIEFPYDAGWNNLSPSGKDGDPYLFWLDEGEHTVTLEAVFGRAADVIKDVSGIVDGLNGCYRKIILQTSANPDPYRDYLLDERIPAVLEEMIALSDRLDSVSAELTKLMGERGSENGILDRVSAQVRRIAEKPEKIPSGLVQFQNNISSLGTWVQDRSNQSLDLDYISFLPANEKPGSAKAGFFTGLSYSAGQFFNSFFNDYKKTDGGKDSIVVWASTGRDQTAVIKNLVDEDFTTKYNVKASVKMIQAAALLPAVVAGIGPDAVLYADNAEPMNFASRTAVVDLTQFDDFSTVKERFAPGAFNPYTYNGKVYALPEQQVFSVLFYRKDIFEELGLTVPDTWDEVNGIVTELSKNNMQFGLSSAVTGYCLFLYQNDGFLYTEGGKASGLDTVPALDAFRKWSKFFSEYKLPVAYDFVNRFRSGQMPIAVQDYTAYNTLEVFAPEIKGKWGITTVPGTVGADGTINRSEASGGTACFVLNDSKNKEEAWKFISWWTSADIQSKFGQRIEDKLGASARFPTANIEAASQLPWSSSFYNTLGEQWQWVIGTPEVPGGYFTGRHLNNAFRSVVYKKTDSTETMLEYVKIINQEIDEKQAELSQNLEDK